MTAPSLPLRYRVPNPPGVFVGRESEIAWVSEAVQRSPVTLVCGPGGLGKTALVLAALHRKHARRLDRTIFIALESDSSDVEVRQEILRAVASAASVSIDWTSLQGDVDALTTALLDLAEQGSFWVVLDDLHHAQGAGAAELVRQLARYARKSRWIGTSRMDLRDEDEGADADVPIARIVLGAMPDGDLGALARAWDARSERDVARMLAVCGGSPWLLRRCLATGRAEATTTREGLLAGLDERASVLLDALALLDAPVPASVAAAFVPAGDEEVDALERRGLLERSPAGLRLHDVVRAVLRAQSTPAQRDLGARAAEVLARVDEPGIALEGARLWALASDVDALRAFLDARGDALVADGYAPRLWRLIEPIMDERLASWRLRCAAELGNPTALGKVQEPADPAPRDRLTWAQALYARGDLRGAVSVAEQVLEGLGGAGGELGAQAVLVLARACAERGDVDSALGMLERAADGDGITSNDVVRLEGARAAIEANGRDPAQAIARATVLRARVHELRAPVRDEVVLDVAQALWSAGHLDAAREALDSFETISQGHELALFHTRRARWLAAAIDVDAGALDEAAGGLAELEPFARAPSILRPRIHATSAALRVGRGDMDEIDAVVGRVSHDAERFDAPDIELEAEALSSQLATLSGLGPREVAGEARGAARSSRGAELARLRAIEGRLRRGERIALGETETRRPSDRNLAALARALRALAAALAGDAKVALTEAHEGVREAAASGNAIRELEAWACSCEVSALCRPASELAACAQRMRATAERVGSRRFMLEAELYAALARAQTASAAVLESIAAQDRVAPVAARRARMWLGGDARSDVFDSEILARLATSRPEAIDASEAPAREWQSGWGIDERSQSVWLPGGRTVELAKKPLHWRVLMLLAERRGRATKEELVVGVWAETEYHPLRHDARLQMAIRKLRELIEENPSDPDRLVTTDEGYALAAPPIRLWRTDRGHVRISRP